MNAAPWNGPPIYEDEDAEALLERFIELCAKYKVTEHGGKYSPAEIGKYVFANQRNPGLRGEQCAEQWWFDDIAVKERIHELILKGPKAVPEASETELIKRSLQIADDANVPAKDRISAIRLAGELQGMVKKSVEGNGRSPANSNDAGEFLRNLAKALPN